MTDFAFDNESGDGPRGVKRLIVPVRRILRRILRPIFLRQAELMMQLAAQLDETDVTLQAVNRRLDHTSDQIQDTIAFGWDYVAMARRLAALEDRVATLHSGSESLRDDDGQLALPFPDFELNPTRAMAC